MTTQRSVPPDQPRVYAATTSGIPPLRPYLRDLWAARPLIWQLAVTDLRAKHYNTALGQAWLILNPLLLAAVYVMVRQVLRPAHGADQQDVIAHLVTGVMFFQLHSSVMMGGARSLMTNSRMILNTRLPQLVFPSYNLVGSVLEFVPTVGVLVVANLLLEQPVGPEALALIPLTLLLLAFAFGIGLLLAPISVFFRDTSNFLRYVTRIWLFSSPILFQADEIQPNLLTYLRWNPLFPTFAGIEQVFDGSWPEVTYYMHAGAWAAAAMGLGLWVFLRKERDVAVHL